MRPALDWGGTKRHPGCCLVLCNECLPLVRGSTVLSKSFVTQRGLCSPTPQSPRVVAGKPGKSPRQRVKEASQFLLSQPWLVMLLSSFKVFGAESRSVEQVVALKLLNIMCVGEKYL